MRHQITTLDYAKNDTIKQIKITNNKSMQSFVLCRYNLTYEILTNSIINLISQMKKSDINSNNNLTNKNGQSRQLTNKNKLVV